MCDEIIGEGINIVPKRAFPNTGDPSSFQEEFLYHVLFLLWLELVRP
jgi:hypothetical protein